MTLMLAQRGSWGLLHVRAHAMPSTGHAVARNTQHLIVQRRHTSTALVHYFSNGTGSRRGVHAFAAAQTTESGPSSTSTSQAAGSRSAQLADLLQETFQVAVQTGPRGLFRALQGGGAVLGLLQEYAARGSQQPLDPPQVVVRKLFERMGATYIKLGQFVASSPSLFPDEYVLECQKLLDKTEPVPWSAIKAIIEAELKGPFTQVFASIDPVPLASASVAQVHAAVLKGSNKEVVIKVLKPGVEDVVTTDMAFVYLMSRYLEFLNPELSRLSLTGIVGDIRTSMLEEVDFMQEAQHIQQFATFLDTRGFRSVASCPEVYLQHSSRRMLVLERFRGVPLTDYAAIRSITAKDPEAVLVAALNTWFASVMGAETFHADVHAGNLLVLPSGKVAFIDFGIVGRISPTTWRAVEALVGALAVADYETMARALATIGACNTDVDYNKFGRDLETFFTELEQVQTQVTLSRDEAGAGGGRMGVSAAVEVDQTQLNRLLLNLVRIGETHGVRFPREFGQFLKQLLYFDRYTRLLAPSLQVLNDPRINVRNLSRQYT